MISTAGAPRVSWSATRGCVDSAFCSEISDYISEESALSPAPRFNHVMAYDEARKVIVIQGEIDVVFGLVDESFSALWEWNGSEWSQPHIHEPRRRNRGLTPL